MRSKGIVYVCPKGDWKGEKFWAADHYARKHSTIYQAPIVCRLCEYKCGNKLSIKEHVSKKGHLKAVEQSRMESETEYVIHDADNYKAIMNSYHQLTPAASRKYWAERDKEHQRATKKKALRLLAAAKGPISLGLRPISDSDEPEAS